MSLNITIGINSSDFYLDLWYFREINRGLEIFYEFPCALVALPGNIVILVTLFRSACGLSNSARFCHAVMAAADLLTLLCYCSHDLLWMYFNVWTQGIVDRWAISCNLLRFLTGISIGLSTSAVSVFCVERVYFVYKPLQSKQSNCFRSTVIACCVSLLLFTVLNASLIGQTTSTNFGSDRTGKCVLKSSLYAQIASLIDFCLNLLLNLAQAFVTFLLVFKLTKVRRVRNRMLAVARTASAVRREKLIAVSAVLVSVANLLIIAPQYVFKAILSLEFLKMSLSARSRQICFVVLHTLLQVDAILWCDNVFALMRIPAFRRRSFPCFFSTARRALSSSRVTR